MKAVWATITAGLLLAAAAPAAVAAPANVAAAVAAKGRPAEAVALDAGRRPVEVLRFLGLERGDRALDLFSGTGYYSEIMARAVGRKGAVLAWDIPSPYSEEATPAWQSLSRRVPNAYRMITSVDQLVFAPASFDLVMLHLNYHDTYWESTQYRFPRMDPGALLAKIFDATKPGGVVGVIDHVADPGGDPREVADKLHRIDPAIIRADFERAGFVFDAESDVLRNSADDHSKLVFDPEVRGRTDRVVYRFRKPG